MADKFHIIVQGCLRGDARYQKQMYEALAPRMLALCRRYAKDSEEAKDIFQDGFVTLFEKIDQYKGEGAFEGWARKIFVRTALMHIRRNNVLNDAEEIDMADLGDMVHCNVIDEIQTSELMRLIDEMPQSLKVVFNLSVIEGYSHVEISKMLGVPEGTLRSRLSRGREWLQAKIKIEK